MAILGRGLEVKDPDQVRLMRRAGLVVGETLEVLRAAVRPGLTTGELDAIAEDAIRSRGATPSFLGYHGFPATICVSVDEEVVHGIPGDRVIAEGDLVSIDCGAIVEGWHGDSAVTVEVGDVAPEARELSRVTEEAMWRGIATMRPGARVLDIGRAVEGHVRSQGHYGVVADYTGHGIGTEMHLEPDVPNVALRGRGAKIVEGLALAVEPMVTLGSPANHELDDEWTVVTDDGSWAAHWEHTAVVTERGTWVLTALDGGEEQLTRLGVPFGAI